MHAYICIHTHIYIYIHICIYIPPRSASNFFLLIEQPKNFSSQPQLQPYRIKSSSSELVIPHQSPPWTGLSHPHPNP